MNTHPSRMCTSVHSFSSCNLYSQPEQSDSRQHAVVNSRIVSNVHDALTFYNTSDILTVALLKIQSSVIPDRTQ
jgi:hypothetical protein